MNRLILCATAATVLCLSAHVAIAQEGNAPPANGQTQTAPAAGDAKPAGQPNLPEVKVIQEQPKPKKPAQQATQAKPKKQQAPQPVQQAEPDLEPEPAIAEQGAAPNYAVAPPPSSVKISPLAGSEVPIEKIPRGVSTLSAADIKRDGAVIPQDILNNRIPGVVVDDLQGNAFETGVQYRGFEASPVNGLPQGLAVYQNGVRINEAFGDTVNWSFIPTNAIQDLTVMSSNPIFGLNAIGGSLSLTMKDGFLFQGAEIDTRFGSFGRRQVSAQAGANSGGVSLYGAFEGIDDDGFRDFSDAEIRRGYADIGFKGDSSEFHFNYTGGSNYVGVTAAVPPELLAFGRERTFTSPQTTFNDLQMFSLNGSVRATDSLTFSGVAYTRKFRQKHDDGNIAEFEECDGGVGLCTEDGDEIFAQGALGVPIDVEAFEDLGPLGSIDRTSQDARSYGGVLQASDNSHLFGFKNLFVAGLSYDTGRVKYTASSQLGTFLPRFVVDDTGPFLDGPSTIAPRALTTTNDYFGAYVVDTINLTEELALTVGGRFNHARIEIKNNSQTDFDPVDGIPDLDKLNGVNEYNRFNPSAGLTYTFSPALTLFGGYSEANRAPTAAEIACSDPENPCIIESALASDPPLEQVVSKTWEAGLRGQIASWSGREKIDWSLGAFFTTNSDDIIQIADEQQGRGYFANAGETRRQGIEAAIAYRNERLFAYASYAFIDATFESSNIIPSENNPAAGLCPVDDDDPPDPDEEEARCVFVTPGDRLPGVPRHRFKAGFDYKITPQWTFGADVITASDQIFYGDEGNDNSPLPGYAKVNLHTSYDVTENVQIYGLIENLFDKQYGIYGTYINVDAANGAAVADPSLPPNPFDEDNAKTITPAIPFAAYGGIRMKF